MGPVLDLAIGYGSRVTERRTRLLCHHCAVPITADDRTHYGYQCHACVVREHELVLLVARDPDHPDVGWLDTVPVKLGSRRKSTFS